MKHLSALIFMIGCLIMGGAAVWVWMNILVFLTRDYGPGFGLAGIVLTCILIRGYHEWLALPYRAWLGIWRRFDDRL